MGMAMSFGAVLLTAGAKGHRSSLPHSRIMIHQPLIMGGGISGQATDIEIEAKEMSFCKKQLTELLAFHTGKPYAEMLAACERNNYMTPEEAKEYGLIDFVVKAPKGY
jgi:ATP-dependent Clp protease protease subunit